MTSEKMYGVFEHQGKEYPFVLEGQILTIPQIPFQYKDDFKQETHIESIQGVTNNNQSVVFIGCDVLNSNSLLFTMEVKLSILGYIVLTNGKTSFDRIDFYSEGINGFYSPRNAYQIEDDDHKRVTAIKLRDVEDYKRDYECVIDGERIQLGLNIYMRFNLSYEKKHFGTAESLLSMSFGEKKEPHDVLKYSLYLMDFLEFVNFEKNIPLERIDLFEGIMTENFVDVEGRSFFRQRMISTRQVRCVVLLLRMLPMNVSQYYLSRLQREDLQKDLIRFSIRKTEVQIAQ